MFFAASLSAFSECPQAMQAKKGLRAGRGGIDCRRPGRIRSHLCRKAPQFAVPTAGQQYSLRSLWPTATMTRSTTALAHLAAPQPVPELRDTAEWVQRNERLVPSRNLVGAGAAAFSQGIGVLLHIILDDCGGGKAPSDTADPRSGIGKPESDGPQRLR
jgi:hypothetical protein